MARRKRSRRVTHDSELKEYMTLAQRFKQVRYVTIALIFIIPVAAFILWLNQPVHTNTVQVTLTVTEPSVIGIPPLEEGDELLFNCPRTGVCTRNLSLTGGDKALIKIKPAGEAGKWISMEKNEFVLEGNAMVPVSVTVPGTAEARDYHGTLVIEYYRLVF